MVLIVGVLVFRIFMGAVHDYKPCVQHLNISRLLLYVETAQILNK